MHRYGREIQDKFVDTARAAADGGSVKARNAGGKEEFVHGEVGGHLSTESASAEEEQKRAQQGA
jgi:hypothetical protein